MIHIYEKEYNHLMWVLWTAMYRMYEFGERHNTVSAQCEVQGLEMKLKKELFEILK